MNDIPYFTAYFDMFMWSLILFAGVWIVGFFAWHDGYYKGKTDEVNKQMEEDGI